MKKLLMIVLLFVLSGCQTTEEVESIGVENTETYTPTVIVEKIIDTSEFKNDEPIETYESRDFVANFHVSRSVYHEYEPINAYFSLEFVGDAEMIYAAGGVAYWNFTLYKDGEIVGIPVELLALRVHEFYNGIENVFTLGEGLESIIFEGENEIYERIPLEDYNSEIADMYVGRKPSHVVTLVPGDYTLKIKIDLDVDILEQLGDSYTYYRIFEYDFKVVE